MLFSRRSINFGLFPPFVLDAGIHSIPLSLLDRPSPLSTAPSTSSSTSASAAFASTAKGKVNISAAPKRNKPGQIGQGPNAQPQEVLPKKRSRIPTPPQASSSKPAAKRAAKSSSSDAAYLLPTAPQTPVTVTPPRPKFKFKETPRQTTKSGITVTKEQNFTL